MKKIIILGMISACFSFLQAQNKIKEPSPKWNKAKRLHNGASLIFGYAHNKILNKVFHQSVDENKMKNSILSFEYGLRIGKMPFLFDFIHGYNKFIQRDSSVATFYNKAMHLNKFEGIISMVILPDFPHFTPTIGVGFQRYSVSGKIKVVKQTSNLNLPSQDEDEFIKSRIVSNMPILALNIIGQPNKRMGYYFGFKQGFATKKISRSLQTINIGFIFRIGDQSY